VRRLLSSAVDVLVSVVPLVSYFDRWRDGPAELGGLGPWLGWDDAVYGTPEREAAALLARGCYAAHGVATLAPSYWWFLDDAERHQRALEALWMSVAIARRDVDRGSR
jgi:hypothetical protein